jgi:hypothetical protein
MKISRKKNKDSLFSGGGLQENAEEANEWLKSLSKSSKKLPPPLNRQKYQLYHFERLSPEDQRKYSILFKSPKIVLLERLIEDLRLQIDDFFISKPDPIFEKFLPFVLKSLHEKIDVFLQGKGPYKYMDMLVEAAYRKEISIIFKKILPKELKGPELGIRKIKDAVIQEIVNIEQKTVEQAILESAEDFTRNEMFAYVLSNYLKLDIIAPCSLASFEIEDREVIGLGQVYIGNGLNGIQIINLAPLQRRSFSQKISRDILGKCTIFAALLFHTDINIGNLHFLMDGGIVLAENQYIMPQHNTVAQGGRSFTCWLLALQQARATFSSELLDSVTKWNEKEILKIASQFYHENSVVNKNILASFEIRLKQIKELCQESLSGEISLTPESFIFRLYPAYKEHWDVVKNKAYPFAAIASYVGILSSKEIEELGIYNPKASYPIASGLQAPGDPFLSDEEARGVNLLE